MEGNCDHIDLSRSITWKSTEAVAHQAAPDARTMEDQMKIITAAALLAIATTATAADTYTKGYVRKDGVYVQPHYSTAPDNSRLNNYSTQGNVNPYTGQPGTVNPYTPPSSPYISPTPSQGRRLLNP